MTQQTLSFRRRMGCFAAVTSIGALGMLLPLFGSAAPALAGGGPAQIGVSAPSSCAPFTTFKRSNFDEDDSATIDNKYYPLVPGTQFTLQGQSNTGGQPLPHKVVLIVTDLVKEINGVTTRVLWDRDFQENVLTESELAFHAQDKKKNIWNLGEYPEEFENGVFTGAPNTWIAGVNGAKAGVILPGDPQEGKPAFLQGKSPDIDFLDCGKVTNDDAKTCAAGKCYKDVVVVDETSPLEPDSGVQRKFYAPHVGNVKITAVGDPEGETLVLTSKVKLDAKARLEANLAALGLDSHAYQVSDVYKNTEPAEFEPCDS